MRADAVIGVLEAAATPAEGIAQVQALLAREGLHGNDLVRAVVTAACGGDVIALSADGRPVNPLARKYLEP
jgi:hypothetical protein